MTCIKEAPVTARHIKRMMWTYRPELLARPVPRYTSYPTAAEFTPSVGAPELEAALDAIEPDSDVSLYVHIPYCQEICWYCACNTGKANKAHRLHAYLEALEQEIYRVAERVKGKAHVRRIAFGGGSPNAIAAGDFVRLLQTLIVAFNAVDPVISLELDPRGFDGRWATVMAVLDIERVSLGVQTFAPHVQAAVGRIQPYEDISRTVDYLRAAGVRSVNFDLMYGLPHQSQADLDDAIDKSIALGADRIALFGYAHVPSIVPRQRRIDAADLPDQPTRFDMAAQGYDRFTAAGYQAVGFDHFAKPDDALAIAARNSTLRRNFQGFTEDPADNLIGLGATAISSFPGALIQNEKNAGVYRTRLSEGQFPAALGILRSGADRAHGRVIETLLCQGQADLAPIGGGAAYRADLLSFIAAGLAELEGDALRLTSAALPYARTIAALFDPYRTVAPTGARGRFSTAV